MFGKESRKKAEYVGGMKLFKFVRGQENDMPLEAWKRAVLVSSRRQTTSASLVPEPGSWRENINCVNSSRVCPAAAVPGQAGAQAVATGFH